MCWAVGILLLPLGDFHNLIYHPIKDFLLIFSLISPPFSRLYGFVPHGSSVPIFFPSKHLQLILLLKPASEHKISQFGHFRIFFTGKSRLLNPSALLLDCLTLTGKRPVLKYYSDYLSCVDRELPTRQCLDAFASAYAPLEYWFLCVPVCSAPCDICGRVWSHKAQEMLQNPCCPSAEVTSQSALSYDQPRRGGHRSLCCHPHTQVAHSIFSCHLLCWF